MSFICKLIVFVKLISECYVPSLIYLGFLATETEIRSFIPFYSSSQKKCHPVRSWASCTIPDAFFKKTEEYRYWDLLQGLYSDGHIHRQTERLIKCMPWPCLRNWILANFDMEGQRLHLLDSWMHQNYILEDFTLLGGNDMILKSKKYWNTF